MPVLDAKKNLDIKINLLFYRILYYKKSSREALTTKLDDAEDLILFGNNLTSKLTVVDYY
jgi:hypothetical protein